MQTLKLTCVVLLACVCLHCSAMEMYDRCSKYQETSYDGALCDAMIAINIQMPKCFNYSPQDTESRYQSLCSDLAMTPVIIDKFLDSCFIKKSCLKETRRSEFDDAFFFYFRVSLFAKEQFKKLVRESFPKNTAIPEDINVAVPGCGVFFEASAVFELFSPKQVMCIDPDQLSNDISLQVYQHPIHRKSIDENKLKHILASLGSLVAPKYSNVRNVQFEKGSSAQIALFIHPGPVFDFKDELNPLWKEVFSHTMDHLADGSFAIFILQSKKELDEIKHFAKERNDYRMKSSFCQEGLLMRPFQFPDKRIYKCVLNVKRVLRYEL